MVDEGIEITADGATIGAKETVSTGEYESGEVWAEVDLSISGVDVTGHAPTELRKELYALKRSLQSQVKSAAEVRRKEAQEGEEPDEREHEVN